MKSRNTLIEYFKKEKEVSNPSFLSRFQNPSFKEYNVLDLGCGHGALTIDIAQRGAKNIIGIDLNEQLIDFANKNLTINYSFLNDKIKFIKTDLRGLGEIKFDIIISKATFEHIIELDKLLSKIKEKLKIGGRLIAGFGPLYNSFWGDHNRLRRNKLPWAHLFFSKKYLINRINKKSKEKVHSIYDLGLNGLSLKEYEKLFYDINGLKVVSFKTNVVPPGINLFKKLINNVFNIFSIIPGLREYFTHNIYLVMQRVS